MSAHQEASAIDRHGLVSDDDRVEQDIVENVYCIPTAHTRGSSDPRIRRSEVIRLYDATIQDVSSTIEAIRDRALHQPVPRLAFTRSVRSLVFRIFEVLRYGPLVGSAELAWKVTLRLAECCIVPPDSPLEVVGEERECNEHHDRLDRRMTTIAKLQQKCGKAYWLNDERVNEIEPLKLLANAPERYPAVSKYLEQILCNSGERSG